MSSTGKNKNVEGVYPLSPAQQGMLFHSLYEPSSGTYVTQVVLDGVIGDTEAFERAWNWVIERHGILRSAMMWENLERPLQVVGRKASVSITHIDWRDLTPEARAAALDVLLDEDRRRGFKLSKAPLMRLALLRLDADRYQVVWTFHHILLDGWSLPIVLNDLRTAYDAFVAGQDLSLPPARPYADYIAWLGRQERTGAAEYWRRMFDGFDGANDLRIAAGTRAGAGAAQASARAALPADVTAALQSLAQEHRLTISTCVFAAWALVVSRYSGRHDVTFGTTVSGRPASLPGVESMVGLFINVLPTRVSAQPSKTLIAWLQELQTQQLELAELQHTPLLDVQKWIGLPPRQALFESIVAFENYPSRPRAAGESAGLQLQLKRSLEKTNYPLTVVATPGRQLSLAILHDVERFDTHAVAKMVEHLRNALVWMASHPDARISDASLVDDSEQRQLITGWNDTARAYPQDATLHALIETQVDRTPDQVAVSFEREEVTYRDLDARANRLAHRLQSLGVGPEILVGVCLERSIDLVVALVAVLKAGGAYLPLEPDYPKERLRTMAADSGCSAIITHARLRGLLDGVDVPLVCPEEEGSDFPAARPASRVSPDGLAYVIYTSGSTGKPKGAMNSHRGICNRLLWMQEQFCLASGDRVLQKTPFSFDVSVWEFFWPLLTGAQLVVARPGGHQDPRYLADTIRDAGITTVHFVPSMLQAFLDQPGDLRRDGRSLTRVICSGEALSGPLARRCLESLPAELHNLYGPTEAAVDVTHHACRLSDDDSRGVPIGRPVANTKMYVLDGDLHPAPIGVAGELYIGGVQVGRGYLNRGALTADRFIPDPLSAHPGARLYRTGDAARMLPNGEIEYIGRLDHQVKIRGNRIELGEIESRIALHSTVREAVAMVRGDEAGVQRLVCYVVAQGEPASTSELRRFLSGALPDYMVPSLFVFLDEMPHLPSGKVNRSALPAPGAERPELDQRFESARTPMEEQLAGIWCGVLRVSRVGVHDSFFELGGDSILSLQIVSRAAQAGIRLTPRDVFDHPTIAELATIASMTAAAEHDVAPAFGATPLTPIQRWFFEQPLGRPQHFNQAALLEIRHPLDESVVRRAVDALVQHHDALRIRIRAAGSKWVQEIAEPSERQPVFTRVSLSGLSREVRETRLGEIAEGLQESLDFTRGIQIRVALVDHGARQPANLVLVVHHLSIDGVSWRILLEDLEIACRQIVAGKPVELPAKTTSFRQWAKRLAEHARSETLRAELDYWLAEGAPAGSPLPVDHPEGLAENTTEHLRSVSVSLTPRETRSLLERAPRTYGVDVNDVLLTAAAQAVSAWTGSTSVLVDLEGHGRDGLLDGIDLSRTVGWFTTLFPVRIDLAGTEDVGEALRATKEQLRAVPHKGLGYGVLRYLTADGDIAARLCARRSPEILFNYLGQFSGSSDESLFARVPRSAGHVSAPKNARRHLIDITAFVSRGRLQVEWRYCGRVHDKQTIDALVGRFEAALRAVLTHCAGRRGRTFTPSDFRLARLDRHALDELQARYAQEGLQDLYVASPMQQGMLFHSLSSGDAALFVTQITSVLRGPLNRPAFREAWQQVIDAEPLLRTAFAVLGDGVHQVVCRKVRAVVQEMDCRALSPAEQQQRLDSFIADDRRRGFEIERPPLLRVALLRVEDQECRMVLTLHHAILDGWSLPILLRDVFGAYEAMCRGREWRIAARRPFRDYIAWLEGRDRKAAERYWRETLRGVVAATPLPARARPESGADVQHATGSTRLSPALTSAILRFAKERDLTVNAIVQGAWVVMLARSAGVRDVIYGTTVSGRPADFPGIESMLGLFINTLPMRVAVDDTPVSVWLRRILDQQLSLQDFDFTALSDVQGWSEVRRGSPLFESIFVFENYPAAVGDSRAADLRMQELRGIERVNYPLALVVKPSEGLFLQLVYQRPRFDDETAAVLLRRLEHLLQAIVAQPDLPVSELRLVDAGVQQQMEGWNDTAHTYPRAASVQSLVERQAEARPDSTAVVWGEDSVSYADLNVRANRIAHYLRRRGVVRGARVALGVRRGIDLVAAMLGILKAGGAYVPLDPDYPQQRLAFMLADTNPAVLLTERAMVAALPAGASQVVVLDEEAAAIDLEPPTNPAVGVSGDDLAYVIYTSGSTGTPKGVCVTHRGIVRLVSRANFAPLTSEDVIAQASNSSFDAATFEFWGALINGARMVGVPKDVALAPQALADLIAGHGISALFLTTALFNQVARERPSAFASVRHLMFGGEAVDPRSVARVLESGKPERLLHVYGPTENTTFSTWFETTSVPEAAVTVPIGRAVSNSTVYILDDRMQAVAPGEPGEIFVGGDGLAVGYYNRPAITAEKFVPSPFGAGDRLYRTGDIGRWTSDGDIEFIGRNDHQVKIRGFRIELGEIESRLGQHPLVHEAVVVVRDDRGEDRLIAYVVPPSGASPTPADLSTFVEQQLPGFMVPSAFVLLASLPLTVNGKIDRAALPDVGDMRPDLEVAFVAPRSGVEAMLAELWGDLLGVSQVGAHDNFFDLGGHSLLATQIVARVREAFDVELRLRDLFGSPTVAELAVRIADLRTGGSTGDQAILRASRERPAPLSPGQRRLWFLSRFGEQPYHSSMAFRLSGPLNATALEDAIREVVRRHEILRTSFPQIDADPVQVVRPAGLFVLEQADLRGLPRAMQETENTQRLYEMQRRAFDLENGIPLRGILVKWSDGEHVLALTMHHIVSDAWSIGILCREIGVIYEAYAAQSESPLPEPEIQYADFASWQHEWMRSSAVEEQIAFWKTRLAGAETLQLWTDRPRPPVQTFNGAKATALYPKELIGRLRGLGREHRATLFMTLLAAFNVLLHRYSGQEDILVGTPTAGRSRTELEGLVGFFINTLVLRTDLSGRPTFIETLERVKQMSLDAFAHQEVPFDRLVEEIRPERDPSRNPLFQVAFALQNVPQEPLTLPGLQVKGEPPRGESTRFDIEMHLVESPAGLHAVCAYNLDLFDADTIARMLEHFRNVLESIAANPRQLIDEVAIISAAERRMLTGEVPVVASRPPVEFAPALFARQAELTPSAIAVTCGLASLTYGELNARANRAAHHLRRLGVGPDVLVGLYLERSLDLVVAILAVLKAGGAYVPLDPAYPADRLAFMLADAAVPVVVTAGDAAASLPEFDGTVVALDRIAADLDREPADDPQVTLGAHNRAYVIYTSGSTGRPKGVEVTHGNLTRLFTSTDQWFHFGARDVWTLFHSYAFDFSVWEIWGALLYGGRLVVVPYEISRSPKAFRSLLHHEGVTVLNQTPSAFRALIDADLAVGDSSPLALRWVIFGGEALDPQTLMPWFERHGDSRPRLVNMYGITETTVHVTYREISSADGASARSLIGRPIPDLQLYVLDPSGQPAPIGVAGELFVGGDGVAAGYLNRPELTASRFVVDPFSGVPGARLYRTGDRARRLADGDVEYLGRVDHQVKIRGFRIELGEIEAVVSSHDAVRETIVTRREDRAGDGRLVAYIVPDARSAQPIVERRRIERDGLPSGVSAYELPNGIPVFHRNKNETDFLYREIFGDESYLRHGIELPAGACIFDVGANTGIFTVFALTQCPDAEVYAFEPIPPVCEILRLNARLHGRRVHVFDCGVSNRESTAEFTYYPHLSIMSSRFGDVEAERNVIKAFIGDGDSSGLRPEIIDDLLTDRLAVERVVCQLRPLSDVIRERGIERIDLLKVDVEKSELDVLEGIDAAHWPMVRQVVIEVHDTDGRLNRIEHLLREQGFDVHSEQDMSLSGTGLHSVYARRPTAVSAAPADAPVQPVWRSEAGFVESVRAHAKVALPDYMVPSAFVVLDEVPLTPSGKLDRRALPAPEAVARPGAPAADPTNDIEAAIAAIWAEVLEVERVGIRDNFFDRGGHSLLLARVHGLLGERLNTGISIVELFRHPTIEELARVIAAGGEERTVAAPDRSGELNAGAERLRKRLSQRRQVVKA